MKKLSLYIVLVLVGLIFFWATEASAQKKMKKEAVPLVPTTAAALQFGSYRCWSYNVSGGGGSCRMAPPIVINPDGTYQESSTRGTYKVSGNRIHFSKSTVRGPGMITGQNKIIFEYDYRGWRHTVTYLCQNCNPM